MLPTIIKNFFTGYATREYPYTKRDLFPGARGHVEFDDSTCIFCGNCARNCPAAAIEVRVKQKELTFYPGRCIVCEVCVEACPKKSVTLQSKWREPFLTIPVEEHRKTGTPEKKEAAPEVKAEPAPEAKAEAASEVKTDAAPQANAEPAQESTETPNESSEQKDQG